jgi:hypothetical protein
MRDQRPCEEFRSWREMVEDPLIAQVMEADRVSPAEVASLFVTLEQSRPRREALEREIRVA